MAGTVAIPNNRMKKKTAIRLFCKADSDVTSSNCNELQPDSYLGDVKAGFVFEADDYDARRIQRLPARKRSARDVESLYNSKDRKFDVSDLKTLVIFFTSNMTSTMNNVEILLSNSFQGVSFITVQNLNEMIGSDGIIFFVWHVQ